MTWRVAQSILTLRGEVDAAWPNRSKASDGTIGDAAHATRDSDHNPWVRDSRNVGVVTAIDITHDPRNGCVAAALAERFRGLGEARDPRVKYVIWSRRIYNPSISSAWRPYNGSNPHTKHVHLSVSSESRHYDSTIAWGIADLGGLTVADVDKILRKLHHLDDHLHQIRDEQGATDRRLRRLEQRVPGNLAGEVDELRRNLRDVAAAVNVHIDDIEGDPTADDPPGRRPEQGGG